jgi:hypothetical protein
MKRTSAITMLAIGLAAGLAALSGCGKSSDVTGIANAPQATADLVAVEAGASASADNGGLMAEIQGTTAAVPTRARNVSPDQIAAADTTFLRGNLTITIGRTFYDATDAALPQWDPSAVRVVVTSWLRGTVTGPRYSATIGRTGTLNIHGLQAAADTMVFDGVATDTTDAVYVSLDGTRTFDVHVLATRTLAGITKLKNTNVNPWPLAGTATWNLSVDKYASGQQGTIEAHYDAVVVVTFNGTEFADVTVNGRFHYKIDLQNGSCARA